MSTTQKQIEQATAITLLSTELNSLASNANALSATAVLVNTIGTSNTDGYVYGKMELKLASPAGTIPANAAVNVWFLESMDDSTFEDGDGSPITPARLPDVVFPLRSVSTAQRIVRRLLVPVGTSYVLAQAASTTYAFNASGNTLKLRLSTNQMV